ncbi:2Fe-2S iron-sulfur cluster-binding protein [Vibrio coralliirubri]|uniref:2Fe-2S iron-sulfur cluster-binding protein n=1 Tax=Vibrio coralliirubri TaxID=1516159 RepID=UPI00228496E4|nr:2Fe-2S iron-sulfur cluster-binding protein [Vibrio coralliirubri]MCY9864938.1 2Fe-2S iron-sulfur cluster-binding protein [Vibrio coralliirubri]
MRINLSINGKAVKAKHGQTILAVAKKNNINIENLCFVNSDTHKPVCRVCSVSVQGVDGFVPSCSTPVSEGMTVTTDSPELDDVRQELVGMILSEAEISNGVMLVDLSKDIQKVSRFTDGFNAKNPADSELNFVKRAGNDFIGIDPLKCIHCDKCLITCPKGIISRASRGSETIITFGRDNVSMDDAGCYSCGDCVRVCSTGALYEKV